MRKKKDAIFEAIFCIHSDTNIINEMIASSYFLAMKIDEKQKKKKRKKERKKEKEKKLQERSWATSFS